MEHGSSRFEKLDPVLGEGEIIPLIPEKTPRKIRKDAGKPRKKREPKPLSEVEKTLEIPETFENTGVTVAAFMLNDENAAGAKEFGSGIVNSEDVRKEILKAIQEEGDNF